MAHSVSYVLDTDWPTRFEHVFTEGFRVGVKCVTTYMK